MKHLFYFIFTSKLFISDMLELVVLGYYAMIFERATAFDIVKTGRRESDIERNNSWILFQVRPLLDMFI